MNTISFLKKQNLEVTPEDKEKLVTLRKEVIALSKTVSCSRDTCAKDMYSDKNIGCCKHSCSGYFGTFERLETITLPILNNMSIDELNDKLTNIYNNGGFWKNGCILPRELRPFLCLRYYCGARQKTLPRGFMQRIEDITNTLDSITGKYNHISINY